MSLLQSIQQSYHAIGVPFSQALSRFEPQYVSEANFAIDANCQTACNFVTADNSTFESVITDYRQSNTTIEELLQESSTSNEDFAKLTTAGFAKFLQSGQLRHSHAMTQIVSKDARNATVNDGGDMGGGAGIDDQDGDSSSSAAGTPTTLAVATPTSSSEVLVQKLKEELRQALSDLFEPYDYSQLGLSMTNGDTQATGGPLSVGYHKRSDTFRLHFATRDVKGYQNGVKMVISPIRDDQSAYDKLKNWEEGMIKGIQQALDLYASKGDVIVGAFTDDNKTPWGAYSIRGDSGDFTDAWEQPSFCGALSVTFCQCGGNCSL
ncbi:YALI0B20790p [Yarrowia lipolytica CLIB122]|uniref:YALI0B20790p n=2 Tax=Yarrowia lipolytica TaxID=4952 RepID=Q6CDW0_YARLI|nr:YALI0B20790p [Yarrowia lipolytica CLIB122]AOW01996.1 hypothetical protein YALI1_B27150g [Yarrowia lipolytica]KAB8283388.1 hypothetical protein BKA91DRAFT_136647 [Yarrowia lipolytica]KAE8173379.1 hypothetical protein BKA90DRAFT_135986 [Yarrowia lipolytica]KAJ8052766.1 hypothetical protein LXG23DRAFT_25588 [Yarrowia lipolytica]RMI95692.1 hypothetical protein BD777DRAFT_129548 [Yarrowia lipolytica]|eukprot:XP_501152.1 YALI0B20790p [Yarrowia lipolytica CLIB122]